MNDYTLYATLSAVETLKCDITVPAEENIQGDITVGGNEHYRHYDGVYVVDPSFDDQILETNGKVMNDDVTVNAIYVSITENLSGGNTVYIGGVL